MKIKTMQSCPIRCILFILATCLLAASGKGETGQTGQTDTTNSLLAGRYGPPAFPDVDGFTALVTAYGPEIRALDEALQTSPEAQIVRTEYHRGVRYQIGTYRELPILVFATGVSVPNAAMTMQMAFDYFPIKEVVYMGIAGAVNPEWQTGDVVIPERWYYHDESVYVNPSPSGDGTFILPDYYLGFLENHRKLKESDPHRPNYQGFGFIYPDEVIVVSEQSGNQLEQKAYFSATPRLLDSARAALAELDPIDLWDERRAKLHVGGNGITGSVFLDNRDYREWARQVWQAEVTEMESATVGHVSYVNAIDWIIIRAISDLAGGQEGKNEENVYDLSASEVGARVLLAILDQLQANQTAAAP